MHLYWQLGSTFSLFIKEQGSVCMLCDLEKGISSVYVMYSLTNSSDDLGEGFDSHSGNEGGKRGFGRVV